MVKFVILIYNYSKGEGTMRLVKLWEADVKKAYELQNSFEENENGFCNSAYGFSFDEFKDYVIKKENYSKGIGLPNGHVPDSVYILVNDEDEYVGIFNLRHCLNEALAKGAGHIGYGIRDIYRKEGYATKGLSLIIEEAWKIIPEDEIYLSVNKNNPASLRVQIKNGAILHHEDDEEYYTRIKK